MGKKYIFKFTCDEDLLFNGDSKVKKVKLVEDIDAENIPETDRATYKAKEIKFYDSYFGSYRPFGEEFKFFIHRKKGDYTGEEAYLSDTIKLGETRAKVTLDNRCEYTITLLLSNNEFVTLPRSSLIPIEKGLDLVSYQNRELHLEPSVYPHIKIKADNKTICYLARRSTPICLEGEDGIYRVVTATPSTSTTERSLETIDWSSYRLVIEKDEDDILSIYLSDEEGNRIRNNDRTFFHINKSLEASLFENSDMIDILLDLNIDDNVHLDTRRLKCWLNNTSTIQKIANNPILQESVAEKLKEKEEFGQMVLDASDSSGRNLATQVASQVNLNPEDFVNKVNEVSLTEGIVNKLTEEKAEQITRGIINTITSEAMRANNPDHEAFKKYSVFEGNLAQLLVNKSEISARDADSLVRNKVSEWALAGYLILRSGLNESTQAELLVREKVNREKLAEYLLEYAELKSDRSKAKAMVESINIANVVDQLLTGDKKNTLVTEVAGNQVLQNAVTNTLKIDKDFQGSVKGEDANPLEIVNRLKHDGRFKREIRGEDGQPGPVGPKGKDANPSEVVRKLAHDSGFQSSIAVNSGLRNIVTDSLKNDENFQNYIAQELIAKKANALGQAILSVKKTVGNDEKPALETDLANNREFQSSVAGNLDLRASVTNTLKSDKGFKDSVKGEDANPLEIVNRLKHDGRFKREIRGEDGQPGPKGEQGREGKPGKDGQQGLQGIRGETGPKGEDANPSEVVRKLAHDSGFQSSIAVNSGLRNIVTDSLKNDENFQNYIAQELTAKKANALGQAILSVKKTVGNDEKPALETDLANNREFQSSVAGNLDLRASVTNTLKSDKGFKDSVKGEDANPLEIVNRLKHDSRFKREIRGEDADSLEVAKKLADDSSFQASIADNGNLRGAVATNLKRDQDFQGSVKGEDANPLEIVNRLKHDGRFKREIRGEDGQPGPIGPKGKDANPAEVVRKLTHDSGFQSSVASNPDLRTSVATNLKSDENFKEDIATQLLTDTNKDTLVTEVADNENLQKAVAGNTNLQKGVAAKLRINPGKAKGPKGEPGNDGQPGLQGIRGETGPKGEDANPAEVARKLAHDSGFQSSIASNPDLRTSVATNLKGDEIFKSAVKGDSGPQGPKGQDGTSPDPSLVAAQLLTGDKKDTLVAAVAGNQDLQDAVANNQDLKDAVTDTLKNEGNLGGGDISKIVDSLKPKFTLQEGKELSQNIYEAKVILDDKVIATLPKIGYYMLDDQLVMYNYATQEKVVIPEDFLCLKVVRLGSGFGNDDYKLTFCNIRGNEFFEYKKYDPEYSRVPDEYKFISLSHAKKEYNPNLSELISHRPLFLIAGELAEQGSDKYEAAVFELTRDGKGKKMATLINEFGYFNQNREFIHCNYHKEPQCRSYTSAEIDEKYQVTDADSEFYLTKYNDIAIHTIPEL